MKNFAKLRQIPLVIVPVSSPKMSRMPNDLLGVEYFICNRDEAETYLKMPMKSAEDYEIAVRLLLQKGAKHVVLTLGEKGVIAGTIEGVSHYPPVATKEIVDVTGAGDAFVSGMLHGVLNEEAFDEAIHLGLVSASKTLQSDKTVRVDLSNEQLKNWRNS